ncbi:MAG: hypothetical protein ACPGGK_16225 [Pikeienuella sp.]
MRDAIVLTGATKDATTAANWAEKCGRKARLADDVIAALGVEVRKLYKGACKSFYETDADHQMVMVSLSLNGKEQQIELYADGKQARGVVRSTAAFKKAERRHNGTLDGLTCVSLAA